MVCVRYIVMKNVARSTIGGLALLAHKGGNMQVSISQNIIVEYTLSTLTIQYYTLLPLLLYTFWPATKELPKQHHIFLYYLQRV